MAGRLSQIGVADVASLKERFYGLKAPWLVGLGLIPKSFLSPRLVRGKLGVLADEVNVGNF